MTPEHKGNRLAIEDKKRKMRSIQFISETNNKLVNIHKLFGILTNLRILINS